MVDLQTPFIEDAEVIPVITRRGLYVKGAPFRSLGVKAAPSDDND